MENNFLKNKKIGVLYGGWSAEREVSIKSGQAVIKALKQGGYKVVPIDVNRSFIKKIEKYKIDIAFNALHGPFGEDGTIQAILETANIPYTGCGVLSSALAMNKIFSKEIFDYHKILTPDWFVINKSDKKHKQPPFPFPVVVKPFMQGSALGVTIAKNKKEFETGLKTAFKYDNQALIEKFIPGKELTVAILGETILPIIEIIPIKGKFYDYKAKYASGGSRHIVPASLSKNISKKVQEACYQAFKVLGCKAVARVDVRLSPDNKPYVLEVNTLPGLTETSLLPDAAKAAGLSFLDLVLSIINFSLKK